MYVDEVSGAVWFMLLGVDGYGAEEGEKLEGRGE